MDCPEIRHAKAREPALQHRAHHDPCRDTNEPVAERAPDGVDVRSRQLGTFGVANALTNGSHDRAVADTFPASDPTTEGSSWAASTAAFAPYECAISTTDAGAERMAVIVPTIT